MNIAKKKKPEIKKNYVKEPEVVEEHTKTYNFARQGKKTSIRYWKDTFKDKFMGNRTVLVNMELSNGFRKIFIVAESEGGFRYRGKRFIFDNESKYYVMDARLYCYDFHEDFSIPIKRVIPVADIKKSIEMSNITEVENATNPATLDRFLKAKIAEGIMKGQQLDIIFRQLKLIGIITMVTTIIYLLLFLFKTGMLQSIKIPGIN